MKTIISRHHTDSFYYECLAKIILEKRFQNCDFKILDKPDLQDEVRNIGVEVTQALPDGSNQAVSLMKKEKEIYGKLRNKGYAIPYKGMLVHPTKCWKRGKPFPAFDYLLDCIQNKVDKSFNYNKKFNELDLYIFTDNLDLDDDTLKVLFLKMIDINKEVFNNIFIDASYKVFLLKNDYIGAYYIESNDYTIYQNKAIKMEKSIKSANYAKTKRRD